MEYKITGIIQSRRQFTLYEDSFEAEEIKCSDHIKNIYEKAYGFADKYLVSCDTLGPIATINCLTVWRKNIFGVWSEVKE